MALPSTTYDTATLVNPGSSLTDFTLIVDLSRMSAAWWAAVDTSDGTKGRAAKGSEPTELACDWIDFDSTNETGLLRVKWSGTLSDTGTQTLRVYPPVAANASVSASDTYGSDNAYDADWAAYWPLHDLLDRTANGYDLTAQGGVTVGGVAGKLGAATDFDGSNDRLENTSATPVDGYPCTYMCWFNSDALGGLPMISDDTGTAGSIYRRFFNSAFPQSQERDGTTLGEGRTFAVTVSTGTWYMQSAQFISDVSRYGWTNKTKSSQNTTDADSTGCDRFAIGGAIWGGAYFNGKVQHSQIHSVTRADDWIGYEYDQVDDQATFWGTWTNVETGGGSSLWTPAELGASLALWLDADDAATISLNGSTVSNWNDKSGNGRNATQGTPANQPLYSATGFNGKPTVENVSGDFMDFGVTSLGRNVSGITCAIVGEHPASASFIANCSEIFISGTSTRFSLSPNFTAGGATFNRYAIGGRRLDGDTFASVSSSTETLANRGNPWIRIGQRAYSDGVANHWTNGTQDLTAAAIQTAGNTSDTNSSAGNLFSGNGPVPNGTKLSEIVVTHSTMTTDDRQKLEGYLAWKWGLEANLPVDHPYKGAAPTTENGISIPVVMHHRRMMGVS